MEGINYKGFRVRFKMKQYLKGISCMRKLVQKWNKNVLMRQILKYIQFSIQSRCQTEQLIIIISKLQPIMSTTFKIIQNHIQSSKSSARKSIAMGSSQHLSPSSRVLDSENGSQSMDEDQLLRLQIKQLERQNKFLKKKITQLTTQLNGERVIKKNKNLGKGAPREDIQPSHLSVQFFFKEINGLMNSVSDLYKVQFSNQELKEFAVKYNTKNETLSPDKRYVYFKKNVLAKKLQKIALINQQRRYTELLQVFSEYYIAKESADKYIRQNIDELSAQVLKLNKMILDNASKRRNSLKGSTVKSQFCYQDLNEKNLLMPWSVKAMSPPTAMVVLDKQKQLDSMKLMNIPNLRTGKS